MAAAIRARWHQLLKDSSVSAENSRDSVRAEVPIFSATVSISCECDGSASTISAARRQRGSWGRGMKVAESSARRAVDNVGKLIPRKEFVYELLSHGEEPRAYALIADQTPRKEYPKHWTRFLRQDTAFFVGAGKIAKFLEAPVYFVSMKRVRRGHYAVHLDVLGEPPYEDIDDAVIVERYARCLERAIIDSPADWLWLQKKWKYAKPVAGEEKPQAAGVPPRVRPAVAGGDEKPYSEGITARVRL